MAFAYYHPAVCFLFFMAAAVFGMFFSHPAFVAVSSVCSALYFFAVKGKKGTRFFAAALIAALMAAALNPVFNTAGCTTLFTYLSGRRFTLEALLYGAATGGMFFSVLLWFSCLNAVMTSDKLMFIFGKAMPSAALILTMIFRFVPNFRAKANVISGARKGAGKANSSNKKQRLKNSMDILSALTSWALESSVVTADSMRGRGYGSAKKTSFAEYRFTRRDAAVLTAICVSSAGVIVCAAFKGASVSYFPNLTISSAGYAPALGALSYAVLLSIPSVIHFWEAAVWRILKSKI